MLHPAVQVIPAGDNPRDVVVAGGGVWVYDFNEPTVREFDAQGRPIRTITLGVKSMAAGANSLWAGQLANSDTGPQGPLAEVDVGSSRVVRTLTTQDSVDVLGVGDDAVWTASRFASRVTRIPLSGGPQQTVPLPGTPTAIAVDSRAVWVAFGHAGIGQAAGEAETGTGGVVQLDPASGARVTEQGEGTVPTALALANGTVWVALAGGMNELDQISEATGRSRSVVPTISVGNTPTDLAVGDGAVWALNYFDATVTRVDAATGRTTATIAFGSRTDPDALPGNSPIRVAVTSGTLWVVDATANTLRRLPDG